MTAEMEKNIYINDLTEGSDGQLWGLSNPYVFGLRVHTGSSFCSDKEQQIAPAYEVKGLVGWVGGCWWGLKTHTNIYTGKKSEGTFSGNEVSCFYNDSR